LGRDARGPASLIAFGSHRMSGTPPERPAKQAARVELTVLLLRELPAKRLLGCLTPRRRQHRGDTRQRQQQLGIQGWHMRTTTRNARVPVWVLRVQLQAVSWSGREP
jgi:hypothetical protein